MAYEDEAGLQPGFDRTAPEPLEEAGVGVGIGADVQRTRAHQPAAEHADRGQQQHAQYQAGVGRSRAAAARDRNDGLGGHGQATRPGPARSPWRRASINRLRRVRRSTPTARAK